MDKPPAVDISARTDPGRDPAKQINEDAYGETATAVGYLAFVCDGMGGHENGREASTLAVKTILEHFASTPPGGSPRDVLRGAIEEANRRVFRIGGPGGGGPSQTGGVSGGAGHAGSTIVAILVHAGGTEVAHVGDSRAFMLHAGSIFQITRDHSMVQQMVDAQMLTPEQAAHHPEANKITRALGIGPDVEVELRAQPLIHAAGDMFVLCSDGLTDLVSMQEIGDVAQGAPYERAASDLVDMANARGGHDNVTVLMVRAREGVAPSRLPLSALAATEEIPAYGPTKTLSIPVAPLLEPVPATQVSPGASSAPPPAHAPAHAPATKTLVGAPLPLPPGSSQVYAGAAGPASVRLPPAVAPAPPAHVEHATPRVSRLLVALVVVVALLALGGAGLLIYLHLDDRNGSHHDGTSDGGKLSLGLGGPARGPVSLVPSHVDAGAGTSPVVNPGAAAGPTGSQLRR